MGAGALLARSTPVTVTDADPRTDGCILTTPAAQNGRDTHCSRCAVTNHDGAPDVNAPGAQKCVLYVCLLGGSA